MRILAIADIHGATDVYEWLRDASEEYAADLVILAGDLLIGGGVARYDRGACMLYHGQRRQRRSRGSGRKAQVCSRQAYAIWLLQRRRISVQPSFRRRMP